MRSAHRGRFINASNSSEESKPDSDMDEPWIMTVKGLHANSKPSLFSIDDGAFSNGSSHSSSPSRDVNLNHLKIVNPAQRSPTHNQGFSPNSSPTREVPESPTQKSVVHLKEKKDDRYEMIESTIEAVKNDEFVLKSPEKEKERPIKHDVRLLDPPPAVQLPKPIKSSSRSAKTTTKTRR